MTRTSIFSGAALAAVLALAGAAQTLAQTAAQIPAQTPAQPTDSAGAPTAPPAPLVAPAAPPAVMPALRPAQVERLLTALEAAPTHGFPADAFATDGLRAVLASAEGEERRRAEARLITETLRYARAMRGQRIDPSSVSSIWAVKPAPYDGSRELAAALAEDRLDAWLASLPPPYQGYAALRAAYNRYRKVADEGGWPKLAAVGVSLRPGISDPRVPQLRRRLQLEGYDVGAGSGSTYDAALADAVRRFQSRRGLNADGVVGNAALAELNISAAARAAQIEANLERWRWIPRQLPGHRIEVNLPTAMLDYYRGGSIPSTMKVAVGARKHETPMMTANITSIVLNPPWNVPLSIVKNEIAPRLGRDPGYLSRQGLKVVGRYDNGLPMLQQAAGPRSALGRVKFDSPNEFAVFLHDTPSRAGFSQADRLLSHGCVRLERPLELARLVLEGDPAWTPERMQQTVNAGKTVRVALPEAIPMYLFYWTAFVDAKGAVYFWDDIYSWDKRLVTALADSPTRMAAR